MLIRKYRSSDCEKIAELFYTTVHRINAKDYTAEQLNVWATGWVDLQEWDLTFQEHYTVVAVEDELIVGFGDIDKNGYLDRLYVHANYQRRGIATIICNELESKVRGKITTYASITSRPFFESRGYRTIQEQQIERQGIMLTNFIMELER